MNCSGLGYCIYGVARRQLEIKKKKWCVEEEIFFSGFYNVKNWKKINKINFNKFIWFYWKMKKKFGGFLVAGMSKKNDEKKKSAQKQRLDGLLPI